MPAVVSARILGAVSALPLRGNERILEIGCGPGAAAREIVRQWPNTFVLGIDRSANAIDQAISGSRPEIASGRLVFRRVNVEEFELLPGDDLFDVAFALRVGALDGRHPEAGRLALPRVRAALVPGGRLFIDGGSPLRELALSAA